MQSRFADQDDTQDFDYRRLPSFSEDRRDRREESPEPSAQAEEESQSIWPWSAARRTASQGRANSRGAPFDYMAHQQQRTKPPSACTERLVLLSILRPFRVSAASQLVQSGCRSEWQQNGDPAAWQVCQLW